MRIFAIACLWALVGAAQAQEKLTLADAFQIAWSRQPEAHGSELRRSAAGAKQEAANAWLAAAPGMDVSAKSDRLNHDAGNREYEVGVSLPLWLPGERSSAMALADAERDALDSGLRAAQLRFAAALREAWWNNAAAAVDVEIAEARLRNAEQLAADVGRRVKAGDLARADRHQADGLAAAAQAQLAEAKSAQVATSQQLRRLLGASPRRFDDTVEKMPPAERIENHPAIRDVATAAQAARRAKDLAALQTRAHPELMLSTTRERGALGEPYAQSMTVGLRIPFGADSRQRSRIITAEAEAVEAEVRLEREREQVAADIEAAQMRAEAARAQLSAAEHRARLARETRGFFEKSFRFGETDLPTRLRVELEAHEADRQHAKSRIAAALAVSQLRQALGLLPE